MCFILNLHGIDFCRFDFTKGLHMRKFLKYAFACDKSFCCPEVTLHRWEVKLQCLYWPWHNHHGWLGIKTQLPSFPTYWLQGGFKRPASLFTCYMPLSINDYIPSFEFNKLRSFGSIFNMKLVFATQCVDVCVFPTLGTRVWFGLVKLFCFNT